MAHFNHEVTLDVLTKRNITIAPVKAGMQGLVQRVGEYDVGHYQIWMMDLPKEKKGKDDKNRHVVEGSNIQ
jgi:hypothetical protein